MNKARIARIARLVALRQQQRRLREAEHAQAQRLLEQANHRRERCCTDCQTLDHEHDRALSEEISAMDLELLRLARGAARGHLKRAETEETRASAETERSREALLGAHQAHRSLELYQERIQALLRRELARAEQRELDELAQRPSGRSESL